MLPYKDTSEIIFRQSIVVSYSEFKCYAVCNKI